VVCTANQCRSPIAAALLRRTLAGTDVRVLDAGFGESGHPPTEQALEAADRIDLDLSAHASTTIDPSTIASADLVLVMERRHVRDLVVLHAEAWPKTFTLKEVVRRGEQVGARQRGQPLGDWLAEVHEGRTRTDLIGASAADDVADPTTDRRVDHDGIAGELLDLVDALSALAWPTAIDGV